MKQYVQIKWKLPATMAVAWISYANPTLAATINPINPYDTIISAVDATADSTFKSKKGNNYDIDNTWNGNGLATPYVSGLTTLVNYIEGNPTHTSVANGNEWFSKDFSNTAQTSTTSNRKSSAKARKLAQLNSSANSISSDELSFGKSRNKQAKSNSRGGKANSRNVKTNSVNQSQSIAPGIGGLAVTYTFSSAIKLDNFLLWNEEFAGIGLFEMLYSLDDSTYNSLGKYTPEPSTFAPGKSIVPYLLQVFSFEPTLMKFFRLLILDCPGQAANPSTYRGCGIGEVAFTTNREPGGITPDVPLPPALPLLASALGLSVWFGRWKRTIKSTSI